MASEYMPVPAATRGPLGGLGAKKAACAATVLVAALAGVTVVAGAMQRWAVPAKMGKSNHLDETTVLEQDLKADFDRYATSNYKCVANGCASVSAAAGYQIYNLWNGDKAWGKTSTDDCMKWIMEKKDPGITGAFYVTLVAGGGQCHALRDNACNIFTDNQDWAVNVGTSTCSIIFTGIHQTWDMKTCAQQESQTVSFKSGFEKSTTSTFSANLEGGLGETGMLLNIGVSIEQSQAMTAETKQTIPLKVKPHGQKCVWAWSYSMHRLGEKVAAATTNAFVVTENPDDTPKCFPHHFNLNDASFQTCSSPGYELPADSL